MTEQNTESGSPPEPAPAIEAQQPTSDAELLSHAREFQASFMQVVRNQTVISEGFMVLAESVRGILRDILVSLGANPPDDSLLALIEAAQSLKTAAEQKRVLDRFEGGVQ